MRHIAVLPLADFSAPPVEEYFADAMTEELITALARAGGWQVISRTSISRYKGSHKAVKQIASELDVDGVIEGAVMRSAGKVLSRDHGVQRCAGLVLAAQHGSHIAVVILTQKLGASRRWVLAAGSLVVAVLYAALAVMSWPVLEIAADERTPILQVPGSVSVGCLMLGFALLAVVTLCRLPTLWAADAVDAAAATAAADLAHGA